MTEPGSKIPSKLPMASQRKAIGIPRLKPQAGPVSMLQSKRVTRQSLSAPDLREVGAAPTAQNSQRARTTAAAAAASNRPVNRKRPAANPTVGPGPKRPLVQSNTNKPPVKPAVTKPVPAATGAKRKVAAWDTKGQLDIANTKLEKLLQEKAEWDARQGEMTVHIKELETKLNESTAKLNKELKELTDIYKAADRKNKLLEDRLQSFQSENDELRVSLTRIQNDIAKKEDHISELTKSLELSNAKNTSLLEDILNLQEKGRSMHNQILDLKGNIRVFCRVRPPLEKESDKALANFNFPDESSIEIKSSQEAGSSTLSQKTKECNFTFDKVYSHVHNQEDVYSEISLLVQSALDGYNVCVFAYGQTGSGKTFTMEGGSAPEARGMIPRAIETIFSTIETQKKLGWNFTVKCSFIEIYNEIIRDLLNPNSNLSYDIKMVGSDDVMVTNLKVEEVDSALGLRNLLAKAQKSRFVAATVMNHESSRSHSITQIRIEASHEGRNIQSQGMINLIDLAGSEKYNSENLTDRRKETCNINKSLSALTLVIMHLAEKRGHVPFRDSKLTHLLMPSLKGNSKTLMLVNIAPLEDCFSETMSSLKFATRVSAVELSAKRQIKSRPMSLKK